MRRLHYLGIACVIPFINALLLELCHQQLPPFDEGCYWWSRVEGLTSLITSMFASTRVYMSRWLETHEQEQGQRCQRWQSVIDIDRGVQETSFRDELSQVLNHCFGPGARNPREHNIIFAPSVLFSLKARLQIIQAEWRPFIVNNLGSTPREKDVDGILYRMLRIWLKEVVSQLEQRCAAAWFGQCEARMAPLLAANLQSPMVSIINEVGCSEQWMKHTFTAVVGERVAQILPSRSPSSSITDVVAAFQYLWYTLYCASQQSELEKGLTQGRDGQHSMAVGYGSTAQAGPQCSSSPSSPNGLSTTERPLGQQTSLGSNGPLVHSLTPHLPSPARMSPSPTVLKNGASSSTCPSPNTSSDTPTVVITSQHQSLTLPSPTTTPAACTVTVPPAPGDLSISSAPAMQGSSTTPPSASRVIERHYQDAESVARSQRHSSTAPSPPGDAVSCSRIVVEQSAMPFASADVAACAAVGEDMEWEDVVVLDDARCVQLRLQQQRRERDAERRRRMMSLSADDSESSGSEWAPVNGQQSRSDEDETDSEEKDDDDDEGPNTGMDVSTSPPTIIDGSDRRRRFNPSFPSPSFPSSSSSSAVHPDPPPAAGNAEEKEAGLVQTAAVSSAVVSVGAVGVANLHTEADRVYADVRSHQQRSGVKLNPRQHKACLKEFGEHMRQSGARARQLSKSKMRNGHLSVQGQKRASMKERLESEGEGHCKHNVCSIDAFTKRFLTFKGCCGQKYHDQLVDDIVNGAPNQKQLKAKLERYNLVVQYPERMFKLQLASTHKTYSEQRAAFFRTYQSRVPRSQPEDHSTAIMEDGDSINGSLSLAVTGPDSSPPPPSAVTGASAFASSSSPAPAALIGVVDSTAPLTTATPSTTPVASSYVHLKPTAAAAVLGLSCQDIPLCLHCYIRVYPFITYTTLSEWVLRLVRGNGYDETSTQSASGEHGNRLRGSASGHPMTTATNRAIRNLALARGDAAPNSNATVLVERTLKQLTDRVNVQVEAETGRKVSQSLVQKVMKSEPTIKLNGRVASIPECDICCDFRALADPTDMDRETQEIHLQIQQGERSVADLHCRRAVNNPNDHLTIYMDGMDQAKTAVPHLSTQQPKWLD